MIYAAGSRRPMSLPHPMPDPPRAARDKLRLVVIGATYASEEPRKKLAALAEHFDLTCLTSDSYTGYGIVNRLADQPPPTNYRLVGLPATGRPDTTTRYLLRGLGRALCEHPADLILVETEPWAWLRWHVWLAKTLWQPRARFGEFSWENARRPGWRGTVLSLVYRAAVATADFVIAGNRDAGDFFLQAGLAADRLLVAPQLGVDTEHFRPASPPERAGLRAEMGCDEGDFLVGFCGRMEEEKGVMDLLHAVRQARGTEPLAAASGGQMRLALLGPRGALTPQLEAWQAEYPWLRLYPARTHAGIAAFMQALDLFVLPSHETQPARQALEGTIWPRAHRGHGLRHDDARSRQRRDPRCSPTAGHALPVARTRASGGPAGGTRRPARRRPRRTRRRPTRAHPRALYERAAGGRLGGLPARAGGGRPRTGPAAARLRARRPAHPAHGQPAPAFPRPFFRRRPTGKWKSAA